LYALQFDHDHDHDHDHDCAYGARGRHRVMKA